MENIATIDFKKPYSKIVEVKPQRILKQKVFFKQNGVDYDIAGNATSQSQVKGYYDGVVKQAEQDAANAKEAAEAAIGAAKEMAAGAKAATAAAE
ncbi:MAG: hypothetical protein GY815_04225 [Gammaproteobacteria bacterium]|nr:hypothetical protein [Gammaproteobacteria bacterium]